MRTLRWHCVVVAAATVAVACTVAGPVWSGEVGVVSNIKVLSDKVEDVSSLEAWKRSYIKPGMSDQQKAIAIWQTVVKYRHQTAPPNEFLQNENNVHDVMKTIHVYGYGMCCCAASHVEQLGRYLGFEARGRIIHAHSVPELFYDDAWHLFDASLINYFHQPDGSIASVNDIIQAVAQWHQKNPGYKRNGGKLREFARNEGWKKGPDLLANTEFYAKDGWNLAGTHGWPATMQEYDYKPDVVYEYGYSQGYRVNVQLRPGERLTRNWFNKGLHVNMDGSGGAPGCLGKRAGMGYQRRLGDVAPGRVGNGVHEYCVPLADGTFRTGALAAENLTCTSEDQQSPAVHLADMAKPGLLVLRMPSSYVYLTGELTFAAVVGQNGHIVVSLSDNNGLDWTEIARVTKTGDHQVDLSARVLRRYDYRLKFEIAGKGSGLDSLDIRHDVQHAQTPLPALGPGKNSISFSAAPNEGTVTIEGRTDLSKKGNPLLITDFQPQFQGLEPRLLRVADYGPEGGMVTFSIATPGDIVRLRFGTHWRARDKREGWDMFVSFDDGASFRKVGSMPGPMVGSCTYVTADDVPPGTQRALIRFKSTRQRNTLCIINARIDADYTEPFGGFQPVKITYEWTENDVEKRHTHVAEQPAETYEITCGRSPLMKSLIVELAD